MNDELLKRAGISVNVVSDEQAMKVAEENNAVIEFSKSDRDVYSGKSQDEIIEIQREKAKELISAIENAGYSGFYISSSVTHFGVSTYIQGNYGIKFRISDHGVMRTDRILYEEHISLKTSPEYVLSVIQEAEEIARIRAQKFDEAKEKERLLDEKWERIKGNFEGLVFKNNDRTYQNFETFSQKVDGKRTNIHQKQERGGAYSYEWTEPKEKNSIGKEKPSYDYIEDYDEVENRVNTTQFSIQSINDKFNKEISVINSENKDRITLNVGFPSNYLTSVGIPYRQIILYGNKLYKKAQEHGYRIEDVKNLPNAVQKPMAIFEGSYKGSYALLTNLIINNKNSIVSIDVNKGEIQDINILTSIYDKDIFKINKWINEGKLLRVDDKQNTLSYLGTPAPIAGATNTIEYSNTAKVIQNFENPPINDEKLSTKQSELSTSGGLIYGYAQNGEIYLTERGLNLIRPYMNTPTCGQLP